MERPNPYRSVGEILDGDVFPSQSSIGNVLVGEWPPIVNEPTSALLLRCLELSFKRESDPDVAKVLDRLDVVTIDWPAASRSDVVDVVKMVAWAERARHSWQPKLLGPAYRQLTVLGVPAARLADSIGRSFPEPRTPTIGAILRQLIDFTLEAFEESVLIESDLAVRIARKVIQEFRSDKIPFRQSRTS